MTDSLTALISISPPFPAFPPFAGLSQVSLQSMCHDMCVYLHVDSEHQVPCIFLSSCTWLCVLFSWQSSLLSWWKLRNELESLLLLPAWTSPMFSQVMGPRFLWPSWAQSCTTGSTSPQLDLQTHSWMWQTHICEGAALSQQSPHTFHWHFSAFRLWVWSRGWGGILWAECLCSSASVQDPQGRSIHPEGQHLWCAWPSVIIIFPASSQTFLNETNIFFPLLKCQGRKTMNNKLGTTSLIPTQALAALLTVAFALSVQTWTWWKRQMTAQNDYENGFCQHGLTWFYIHI